MATALWDTWQLWLPAQDQAKKRKSASLQATLTRLCALKEEGVRVEIGMGGYDQGTLYTCETVNKYSK